MVQVTEQSRDEKMAMYMKLSKKKLAEMIIECNEILQSQYLRNSYQSDRGYIEIGDKICKTCGKKL